MPTKFRRVAQDRLRCPKSGWVRGSFRNVGEALAALQAANEPPEFFARSGRMVAVVRDERQRHVIAEVSEAALRGRMARSGFYYKLNKDQERIECVPPLDVVRDILALSPAEWKFPPLEALIETPFLRPDGTICRSPGYDASTCLFYAPAPGLRLPEIPEAPMMDDVEPLLDLLDSAIGDFPFAGCQQGQCHRVDAHSRCASGDRQPDAARALRRASGRHGKNTAG